MVKLGKVPVVTVIHHGNHLHTPFWNWRDKRKVPFYTVVKQILTPEQIKNMSVEADVVIWSVDAVGADIDFEYSQGTTLEMGKVINIKATNNDFENANINSIHDIVMEVLDDKVIDDNLKLLNKLIEKAPGNKGGAQMILDYYNKVK